MLNEKFIASTKKTEDGVAIIPFKNKAGEVLGELHFNLCDIGLPGRFQKLREDIKPATKNLKSLKIEPDGTTKAWQLKERKALLAAEKILKKDLDWCFGVGTYDSLFSKTRPFASVSGTFFSAGVIKALDKSLFLQEEMDV